MARRKLTEEEKSELLARKADVGTEMKLFIENETIQAFFTKLKKEANHQLINLPLTDDDGRRAAATTYQILRKLENYMSVVHKMGERAEVAYVDLMAQQAERLGDSEDA